MAASSSGEKRNSKSFARMSRIWEHLVPDDDMLPLAARHAMHESVAHDGIGTGARREGQLGDDGLSGSGHGAREAQQTGFSPIVRCGFSMPSSVMKPERAARCAMAGSPGQDRPGVTRGRPGWRAAWTCRCSTGPT